MESQWQLVASAAQPTAGGIMKKGQKYHCKRCEAAKTIIERVRLYLEDAPNAEVGRAELLAFIGTLQGISTGRGKHNSAGAEECLLPKTANPVQSERQHEET